MVKKDLIQQENWAEITRLSREAVRAMLGFSLDHVGINCGSEAEADRLARTLCDMFGFAYQMGNSSVQALHAVECTKTPGRGTHGHIAIATSNVDGRCIIWACMASVACRRPARRMPRAIPRPFISMVNSAASPFIWFADKEESL